MSDTITMGRTKRERCSGHWKTQSTNCYKGHEPNDYKDVVICGGRVHYVSQVACCTFTSILFGVRPRCYRRE